MARPIWTGALTFGLVSVPVGLYSATEDHAVRFHQVQRGTADRVRYRRVNERTGDEVEWSEVVPGYPVDGGRYVTLERSELAEVAPGRSRSIEVDGFVPLADIDPIYFDRTYYLLPARRSDDRAYALLHEVLGESGKAALATVVLRDRQHLAAVRAGGQVLVLQTLLFADEVRRPEQAGELPERSRARAGERRQARQLIDAMTVEWHPQDYHDTYQEQVAELVQAKRAGTEPPAAEPAPEPTNVVDLVETLRRSVEQARGGQRRAQPTRRQPAPRREPERQVGRPTKSELYRQAGELDIRGRSRMSREQLARAVREATRDRRRRAS